VPVPSEYADDYAALPALLRVLLDAELSAGNTIVEVGHSHPAPPAGCYFKLARKVTTRARSSGDGLDFHERSNSLYSGVFTDERRFHFLLEPPDPPPPEVDMDARRAELAPRPEPHGRPSERDVETARTLAAAAHVERVRVTPSAPADAHAHGSPHAAHAALHTDTPTGCRSELHFRDVRPPHEVRAALEGRLVVLFTCASNTEELRCRARAHVVGAHHDFELRYVAALPDEHAYSLRIDVSWAHSAPTNHDYFRRSTPGWLSLWTRDLCAAPPPSPAENSHERYRAAASAAARAEAHLTTVAAIQTAILDGLRRGGSYADSHKEGGTHIWWAHDRFVRVDHGDDPATNSYTELAPFLSMLRGFCQFELSRHAGKEPRTERDEWLLILRLMRPSRQGDTTAAPSS
jgi:hypothetical protein